MLSATPAPAPSTPTHRTDIEGLRAVAVLLVVLSHAGVTAFAGGYVGVDVFFVISGFVITSGLLREVSRTGSVSLAGFYARRAVRLLPASVPVLIVTLLATWWWLPLRAARTAGDVLASALYAINLRLAEQGTDYFTHTAAPSPVQHFWSLAVEEQFYLLWPVLLLAMVWLARRRASRRPAAWIAGALGLVLVSSLAASVALTPNSSSWAYFGGHTRAWELAAGALLAVTSAVVPRRLRTPMAALGLLTVLAAACGFDSHTAFPGYAALLPVSGAAALLAAGQTGGGPVAALLSLPPFQLLGRLSYSWYLWHWPALVFGAVALGRPASPAENLIFVVVALGVAAASHHLLENPVRHHPPLRLRPWRGLSLGGALSAAAAVVAVVAGAVTPSLVSAKHEPDTGRVMALSVAPQRQLRTLLQASALAPVVPVNVTPPLASAYELQPSFYGDRCQESHERGFALRHCVYGDADASTTVALFGDSHAGHWFPALESLARQRHWRLVVFVMNECTAAAVTNFGDSMHRLRPECAQWRRGAWRDIQQLRPDLVLAASAGTYTSAADGGTDDDRVWVDGWRSSLAELVRSGGSVAVINSIPHPRDDLFPCLVEHLSDARPCQRSRAEAIPMPARRASIATELEHGGATVIDPTPWLCAAMCPPLVGNTLVYKDTSHLSVAYAKVLAPVLLRQLEPLLAGPHGPGRGSVRSPGSTSR